MATLSTKLTLQSSDTLSDPLNLTCSDTLTVTNPTELSRVSIATGSAQALIASSSAFSYVYIKVISGVNATDFLQVKLGGDALLKVRVGEFAFFPLYSGIAIDAESYGGACVVEYGYWSV